MIRVLNADGMAKSAIQKLTDMGYEVVSQFYPPEELGQALHEFDCIVVRSATKLRAPIIDQAMTAGRLKLAIRAGVGIDNIDVDYAESKGITVRNTPKASSASVAELAIGHMICLARFLHIANHTMRLGEWNKKHYEGSEISGKTLGLIGFGRIAQETAKRAVALGMNVIYVNRSGKAVDLPGCKLVSLDEVLSTSDFISLHAPSQGSALIDAAAIAKMKDGAFIVNTARGDLIDEDALCDALDAGKLGGAALDVFQAEPTKNERLYTHPKVALSPHLGGSTGEAQDRIGDELVELITGNLPL